MRFHLFKKYKASITLEASLVLPIYLFVLISLISLMRMIRIQSCVEFASYSAGKEIALYSYADELINLIPDPTLKNFVFTALSDSYAEDKILKKLEEQKGLLKQIGNKKERFSFLQSKVQVNGDSDDIVDFAINYKIHPLCNFFGISSYDMICRTRLHPWTGYSYTEINSSTNEERIVYITETGTVYHLSKSCSHLDLSIISASSKNISSLKNANDSSYKSCELCMKSQNVPTTIYVTSWGDSYHCSLSCSGLKRTIIEIPLSEVGNRKACSRCGGG